jgi:hypothetical protein
MKHQTWIASSISGLLAVGYILFVYSLDDANFFFAGSFAVSAFCSCALTVVFWQFSRFAYLTNAWHILSDMIQNVLLLSGVMISAIAFMGISTKYPTLLHCSAFVPLGVALLAVKISADTKIKQGELLGLVLFCISSVLPYFVIMAIAVYAYFRSGRTHGFLILPRFLAKPDTLAALVCNLFFTMSLIHGFSVSLAYLLNYSMYTPSYSAFCHIAAFTIALGILLVARRAVTSNAFIFYLAVAPSAVFPGYVLLPPNIPHYH